MGPYAYAMHLISGPRLPFTAVYFGAIVMTVYFAAGVSPSSVASCKDVVANTLGPASQYPLDHSLRWYSTCSLGVVSCQLLPYGQHRFKIRCTRGWGESGGVDERLNVDHAKPSTVYSDGHVAIICSLCVDLVFPHPVKHMLVPPLTRPFEWKMASCVTHSTRRRTSL